MIAASAGEGNTVVVRTTFGLLLSSDRGLTWRWVCEKALGFDGSWDPPVAVTKTGQVFVGLVDGLVATQGGCDVRPVPSLHGELVADLAADGTGEALVAITSPPGGIPRVWKQSSTGSWERLGQGPKGLSFDTIEVAPSDAKRIYLSAISDTAAGEAHLFRSDDGGRGLREMKQTWPREGRLFISGVDPLDKDKLFVRLLHREGSLLLLSKDGGKRFRTVLEIPSSMPGFALSFDGKTVYAGSSNPEEGVLRSDDGGEHFKTVSHVSVRCLRARRDDVLACSDPFRPGGFAVAVSVDRGESFKTLANFDSATAIVCDGGAGAQCAAAWEGTKAEVVAVGRSVFPLDAGSDEDAGVLGDASTSSPPEGPRVRNGAKGGKACGCDVLGSRQGPRGFVPGGGALFCGGAVGVFLRCRRRRRMDPLGPRRALGSPGVE